MKGSAPSASNYRSVYLVRVLVSNLPYFVREMRDALEFYLFCFSMLISDVLASNDLFSNSIDTEILKPCHLIYCKDASVPLPKLLKMIMNPHAAFFGYTVSNLQHHDYLFP